MSGTEGGQPAQADEQAFRLFYDAHFEAVYRYFGRRVSAVADVNDLVSSVFLVAWRRLPELPPSPHERTLWLYGVARRVLADSRKADRRRSRLTRRILATTERHAQATADLETGDLPDVADRVLAAINTLGPRDREVLALVAWEQLTHAEAAEVLGCTLNAFTIRLHRARKRLTIAYAATQGQGDVSVSVDEPTPSEGASDARP